MYVRTYVCMDTNHSKQQDLLWFLLRVTSPECSILRFPNRGWLGKAGRRLALQCGMIQGWKFRGNHSVYLHFFQGFPVSCNSPFNQVYATLLPDYANGYKPWNAFLFWICGFGRSELTLFLTAFTAVWWCHPLSEIQIDSTSGWCSQGLLQPRFWRIFFT